MLAGGVGHVHAGRHGAAGGVAAVPGQGVGAGGGGQRQLAHHGAQGVADAQRGRCRRFGRAGGVAGVVQPCAAGPEAAVVGRLQGQGFGVEAGSGGGEQPQAAEAHGHPGVHQEVQLQLVRHGVEGQGFGGGALLVEEHGRGRSGHPLHQQAHQPVHGLAGVLAAAAQNYVGLGRGAKAAGGEGFVLAPGQRPRRVAVVVVQRELRFGRAQVGVVAQQQGVGAVLVGAGAVGRHRQEGPGPH